MALETAGGSPLSSTRLALAWPGAALVLFVALEAIFTGAPVALGTHSELRASGRRDCSRALAANASRFVILTFHSLGPPFDEGLDLRSSRAKFRELFSPHADDVYMSSPLQLENDPWWRAHFTPYPDSPEWSVPQNKGGHKIGYWKHKALLLHRAMQREPLGTVLMYMDGNVERDAHLSWGAETWRELSNYVLNENGADIWMGMEKNFFVKGFVKTYTLRKICEPQYINAILELPMMLAGRIVMRNTVAMRAMLADEILPLFEDDSLLAPSPDENRHPEFRWHTGDQAIWLPFLYQKRLKGQLPPSWPKFYYAGRGFSHSFEKCSRAAMHNFEKCGLDLVDDTRT